MTPWRRRMHVASVSRTWVGGAISQYGVGDIPSVVHTEIGSRKTGVDERLVKLGLLAGV